MFPYFFKTNMMFPNSSTRRKNRICGSGRPANRGGLVILLFLCLIPFGTIGCAPSTGERDDGTIGDVSGLTTEELEQAALNAQVEHELARIRAEVRMELGPETAEDPALFSEEISEKELESVNLMPDSPEKNRRYAEIVRKSVFNRRLDDLFDLIDRITDEKIKDALLQEIAQACLQDVRSGAAAPADEMRRARLATEKIVDPLRRSGSYGLIAKAYQDMRDREGMLEAMDRAAAALRKLDDTDGRKAHGLCFLAYQLLEYGEKEKAGQFCRDAETFAAQLTDPFAAAMFFLDLANLYSILENKQAASNACQKASGIVTRIPDPRQQATAFLKLAEVSLFVQPAEQGAPPAPDRFVRLRNLVSEAVKIIEKEISEQEQKRPETAPETKEKTALIQDPFASSPLSGTETEINFALSTKELIERKNDVLCKIAMRQAWSSSPQEIAETIDLIDPGPKRDDALVAAIETLAVLRTPVELESWVRHISDPTKRDKVRQTLQQARTTQP